MNKTILALFMLLVGITVGLTAGMFLFNESDITLVDPESSYSDDGDENNRSGEKKFQAPPNTARRSEVPDSVGGGPLGEIIRSTPVDLPTTGEGVILVSAVDESGTAVPDAEFKLTARYESTGKAPDSIEGKVASYIRRLRWQEQSMLKGTTDDAGRLAFANLSDGKFRLELDSDNWKVSPKGRELRELVPGADVKVVLKPCAFLPIRVLMPDGSLAKNAQVDFSSGRSRHYIGWNSSDPVVRHVPGDYSVSAEISGDNEFKTEEAVDVKLTEGRDNPEIILQLKGILMIRGTIDDGGKPRGNYVNVYAKKFEGEVPSAKLVMRSRLRTNSWDGSFVLPLEKPGRYALVVGTRMEDPMSDVVVVEVIDENVEVKLKLTPLRREDFLEVRIAVPDSKKLSDLQFSMGVEVDNSTSTSGMQEIKQSEGVFWVRHNEQNGSAKSKKASYFAVVSCNLGSKTINYKKTSASVVEIVFLEPSVLSVQVTGASENILDDLVVSASRKDGGSQARRSSNLEASAAGLFTTKSLQPGLYTIVLALRTDGYSSQALVEREANVKPGKNNITMAMPVLYQLTVRFDGDSVPTRMRLRRESKDGSRRQSASRMPVEDGKAVFSNLTAGEYILEPSGSGGGQMMTVHVPSQTNVVFKPSAINCLKVYGCAEDSKAYAAGLRNGDVIFGIDGAVFENMPQIQVALSTGAEEKKLSIERDGRTIELKLKLIEILQRGGAQIRPSSR